MASWKKILTASPSMGDLASGSPGSGNYLRGDGSWAAVPSGSDTTFAVSIPASTTKLRLTGSDNSTDDIEFVGSGATTVTRTNENKFTISSTDDNTQLSDAQVRSKVSAGTGISYNSSTGVISSSITQTTNTDINVNVANLTARLPQVTESVTIGDATDVTVTTSGDLVVTGDLTVSGDTTTLNTATLSVEDKVIEVATGTGGGSVSAASGAGLQVNTGNATQEPAIVWTNASGFKQWGLKYEGDVTILPIQTVQYEVTSGTPAGLDTIGGGMAYNNADGTLYYYDAT